MFSASLSFLRARVINLHKTKNSFVFAKAQIVPMRATSIPKLELQDALLAKHLKNEIVIAFTVKVNDR